MSNGPHSRTHTGPVERAVQLYHREAHAVRPACAGSPRSTVAPPASTLVDPDVRLTVTGNPVRGVALTKSSLPSVGTRRKQISGSGPAPTEEATAIQYVCPAEARKRWSTSMGLNGLTSMGVNGLTPE